jgi:hypothetical protein
MREPTYMTAVNRVSLDRADIHDVRADTGVVLSPPMGEVECARMSESQVDQLLVERVQKGDQYAFDLLISKYQHRIVSW